MKNDSNLFKEAIAEAKAVREAAIANAKAALEETITPRLKELLVTKLNEMELEEEEFVDLEEAKEMPEEKEDEEKNEGKKSEKGEEPEKEEKESEEEKPEDAPEDEKEVDLPEDLTMDKLEQIITNIVQKELAGGQADLESDMGDMNDMGNTMDAEASSEEISLEELLAELEQEESYEEDEPNIDELLSELTQFRKETEKTSNRDRQLTEALNTIKSLKQDLTEINLLNAKLLYVNKLMKEFSLSESQVVNIMTAFDKAETVSQAKLVYETVLPNLSKKVKTTVNENRGFASRPAGIAPKKVITENTDVISSEVVNRLQILAGIKKPN